MRARRGRRRLRRHHRRGFGLLRSRLFVPRRPFVRRRQRVHNHPFLLELCRLRRRNPERNERALDSSRARRGPRPRIPSPLNLEHQRDAHVRAHRHKSLAVAAHDQVRALSRRERRLGLRRREATHQRAILQPAPRHHGWHILLAQEHPVRLSSRRNVRPAGEQQQSATPQVLPQLARAGVQRPVAILSSVAEHHDVPARREVGIERVTPPARV
mmetsp:Transcript_17585/g.57464  ORF Transcript_17585/g.57464 Transcript_17585/m.57464 type:complete len:214 (+) Transcript_17585:2775-3416(+)